MNTPLPLAILLLYLGLSTASRAGERLPDEIRKLQGKAPEEWVIEVVGVASSTVSSISTSPRLKVIEDTLHAVTAKVHTVSRTAHKVSPGDVEVIRITHQTRSDGEKPEAVPAAPEKGERHRVFLRRSEDGKGFVPAAGSGSFQKP